MPATDICIADLYRKAAAAKLVAEPDKQALSRARYTYRINCANPGDCKDNWLLLAALAVAQADIGMRQGWIPEVQRIGYAIAKL